MRKVLSLSNVKQLFLLILLAFAVYSLSSFLIKNEPIDEWNLYNEINEMNVDEKEKSLNRADAITAQKMEEFKSEVEALFSKVKEKWNN